MYLLDGIVPMGHGVGFPPVLHPCVPTILSMAAMHFKY